MDVTNAEQVGTLADETAFIWRASGSGALTGGASRPGSQRRLARAP